MAIVERRRSDRLRLTIPLLAEGIDAMGQAFKSEARVIYLNQHGARIEISRLLESGQTVRLINPRGPGEGEFRVVEARSPLITERGGEYGVESLDTSKNIWGIEFQPTKQGETPDAKALLRCRKCHSVALLALTLSEVETVRTIGAVGKFCQSCDAVTPWGYADVQAAANSPASKEPMPADPPAHAKSANPLGDRFPPHKPRRHRRIYMQLRLGVRNGHGEVEVTKTENVSRDGLCFSSERNYHVGEQIIVACPIQSNGQNIELRARVVRWQNIDGTNRKIYAIQFEPVNELTFAAARRAFTANA